MMKLANCLNIIFFQIKLIFDIRIPEFMLMANKFLFKNDVQLKDIYTQDPSIKLMIDDIQNQINEVSKEINSLSGKNN